MGIVSSIKAVTCSIANPRYNAAMPHHPGLQMRDSNSEFLDFVKEQLAAISDLVTGRFFGGTGFSVNGVQFAMVIRNALYFVVDDTTRPEYEKQGSSCFSYATRTRRINVKRYFEAPAVALEEPGQLLALARQSIGIASRTKSPTPKRRKSATKRP